MHSGQRVARINWHRPSVAPAILLLLLFVPVAGAQTPDSKGTNPFASLHNRLEQAIEFHLAQMRETARRAEDAASQKPATEKEFSQQFTGILPIAGPEQVQAARARLRGRGVDAARIFAEEGVPAGLLVVAKVESNFEPFAISPKGARGIWQLMPATATRYGLRVDQQVDERVHPARSTRAAARYLRDLYGLFGDWLLALAAYNSGEARVADAVRRSGTHNFWQLAAAGFLPEETRRYVPAVLAAMNTGVAGLRTEQ